MIYYLSFFFLFLLTYISFLLSKTVQSKNYRQDFFTVNLFQAVEEPIKFYSQFGEDKSFYENFLFMYLLRKM